MDKKDRANKRRQDKHHKKPPPTKTTSKAPKDSQSSSAVSQSAPLIVYDDPYSRRPIEPNWNRERRDLPSDDSGSDDDQLRAADLEKLLQMPPSASGHFFLSNERHWIDETAEPSIVSGKSNQQYGRYFQIDTNKLNVCLSTIPLYERNGYSEELFSEREIDSMKLRATTESNKYRDICSKLESIRKMSDRPNKAPIKCLIGSDALPPVEPQRQEVPPAQPVPCLLGPAALPSELRNDAEVTRSVESSVMERFGEVSIGNRVRTETANDDVVPIGGDNEVFDLNSPGGPSKSEKEQSNEARKEVATKTETKEDIQQWLDDILDM